jgi:hypothetical protein
MANTINNIVFGYPQPEGAKIRLLIDHYGPVSYVQFAPATPAGDLINGTDVGVGGFESAGAGFASYSQDGLYSVQVTFSKASNLAVGSACGQIAVRWNTLTGGAFTAPTTTEVSAATNLNSSFVRLILYCV